MLKKMCLNIRIIETKFIMDRINMIPFNIHALQEMKKNILSLQ